MKYLITGGAGFIGSNYLHYLLEIANKNHEIHNLDVLTYAGNLSNLKDIENKNNYFFHKLNICDSEAVYQLFEEHKFDIVIHFAAESHVDRSILGSKEFVMTNVLGTQTLLDCAKEFKVQRFVHVSTDEVYGSLGAEGVFTENHQIQPNSPYSASKAGSDLLVRSYFETHKLPILITRCSNNYGPYQFPEKLIPLMVTNVMENKPLPVYGKGDNVRDWIHVKDHCIAVDTVARQGKEGQVYNIGGNAEEQNIDIVKRILDIMDKDYSSITYVQDRPGHDFRYAMDFSKLNKETGWSPQYTFEDGLKETVNWYVENQDWWRNVKSGDYLSYYETQYQVRG